VVQFTTSDLVDRWSQMNQDTDLVVAQVVGHSTIELKQQSSSVRREMDQAGIPIFFADVQAYGNRVSVVTGGSGGAYEEALAMYEQSKAIVAKYPDMYLEPVAEDILATGCTTTGMMKCDSPLRGGVAFGGYIDDFGCSVGFRVHSASNTQYMLTAGHCSENVGDTKYAPK